MDRSTAPTIDAVRYFRSLDGVWSPRNGCEPLDYSDGGAVEERILSAVSAAQDLSLSSSEMLQAISDWPSQYHLSVRRANLLRPFKTELQGRTILELGAGCGAVTRFLRELWANVVAVEGSPRRAAIIHQRCRDLPNVEVVCDRIENFTPSAPFDYARCFGGKGGLEGDPIRALLRHVRSLTHANGLLLLAIENQLGLKYFAGAKEDHLGEPFLGINDSYTADTPVTFGRHELESHLAATGFSATELFAPLPDYKMPVLVITPQGLTAEDGFDLESLVTGTTLLDP